MATRNWRAVAELAAAQHGVFTRTQAATAGISSHHLRALMSRGLLDEPVPQVLRDLAAPRTWEQRVAIAAFGVRGVAAGPTAAALHRLDGFARAGHVEVCVPRRSKRRLPGVRVRSSTPFDSIDLVVVDGIPATSIPRTLCDLGAGSSADRVERALDDALRRRVSERAVRERLAALDRPGPSGTGVLRRILELPDRAGVVPDSFAERVTERLLAHPELHPLDRQHRLRDETGRVVARFDLAVPDARLGIEYHSDQWHHGPRRGRGDRRRDLAVASLGWQIIYLDVSDHRSPGAAVDLVLDVVRARRRSIG